MRTMLLSRTRRHIQLLLALCLGISAAAGQAFCAENRPESEDALIAVLQSSASPKEKDAACVELKRTGTERSVPALAALLSDENLSHSARYVLEAMASSAAGKALIDALDHTSGHVRIGIIGSLGIRAEKNAAPKLIKLLGNADVPTACAAAYALGRIDSKEAERALKKALASGQPELRDAAADACLRAAARELANGRMGEARRLYEAVLKKASSRHALIAAHAGIFRAESNPAKTVLAALKSADELNKLAALSVLPELKAPGLTKTVASFLPSYPPDIQVAVIQCMGRRGAIDTAAEIAQQVSNPKD
jgi:hypothetical protein